jgi:hypothetical protein
MWYLPGVKASDPVFMWATPAHNDQNRLTIDLLVHRFAAPNGLDLGVGVLGAALPIVALVRRRFRAAEALDPRVSRAGLALALTWIGCVAFMIAPLPALMVLPTAFAYVQFPWRLLGLAGFLAATAVAVMTGELGRATRPAVALLAMSATLAAALPRGHRQVPTSEWTSEEVLAIGRGAYGSLGYTILGEYLPRGEPAGSVNARVRRGLSGAGVRALSWRATRTGWEAEVDVNDSAGKAELVLPLVAYDVWRVVDESGQVVPGRRAGSLMAVHLAGGRHTLRVTRRPTGPELVGLALSAAGLLAYAGLRRRGMAFPPPTRQIHPAPPRVAT